MSISRTPKQTFVNVVSFMERLASIKESEKTSPEFVNLINASKNTIDGLLRNSNNIPVDKNERKVLIATILNELNEESLRSKYPEQIKDGLITVGDYEFSKDDFLKVESSEHKQLDKSTVTKMSFFISCLSTLSNGMERPSEDPLSIDDNFRKLSFATTRWSSKRPLLGDSEHKPLSPNELADSLTKLSVNGDYLFNLDSGLSDLMKGMNKVFPGVEHMESDVLVRLYDQCVNNEVVQVPINGHSIEGRSLMDLRPSGYRLSGDVPYPEESELRALAGVLSVLEDKMKELPIVDAKGNGVDKESLLQSFSSFVDVAVWKLAVNSIERLMPYSHLDFDSALEAEWNQNHKRSENFVIALDGGFPRGLNGGVKGHVNYSIPEAIREVLSLDSFAENSVSIVSKAEAEKLKSMNIDNLHLAPVRFSKLEESKLKENWLEPKTSAEYLFSLSVERAYSKFEPEKWFVLPHSDIVFPEIARNLKSFLPGLSDDDLERIKESLDDIDLMHKPAFVASCLKDALTKESKDKLKLGDDLFTHKPVEPKNETKEGKLENEGVRRRF
tara:strand:+ start:2628 stop:4298 length:1671 start_codon:yes stop_codon:yes gene_type:complete